MSLSKPLFISVAFQQWNKSLHAISQALRCGFKNERFEVLLILLRAIFHRSLRRRLHGTQGHDRLSGRYIRRQLELLLSHRGSGGWQSGSQIRPHHVRFRRWDVAKGCARRRGCCRLQEIKEKGAASGVYFSSTSGLLSQGRRDFARDPWPKRVPLPS